MYAKELSQKAQALQYALLELGDKFPWAVMSNFSVDTQGGARLKVSLYRYEDDHEWHIIKEVSINNYPNNKTTWDEFMDKVSSMLNLAL